MGTKPDQAIRVMVGEEFLVAASYQIYYGDTANLLVSIGPPKQEVGTGDNTS